VGPRPVRLATAGQDERGIVDGVDHPIGCFVFGPADRGCDLSLDASAARVTERPEQCFAVEFGEQALALNHVGT
jgi:hypothetical protein